MGPKVDGVTAPARPSAIWRPFLPLLLTILVGVAATVALFLALRASERARTASDFAAHTTDRAQAIRAELSEEAMELRPVASYVAASDEQVAGRLRSFVQEFGRFVGHIPELEVDTLLIAFSPLLPVLDRAWGWSGADRGDGGVLLGPPAQNLARGGARRGAHACAGRGGGQAPAT